METMRLGRDSNEKNYFMFTGIGVIKGFVANDFMSDGRNYFGVLCGKVRNFPAHPYSPLLV